MVKFYMFLIKEKKIFGILKMSAVGGNPNESIKVFVRCRPFLENEKSLNPVLEVHPAVNKIIVSDSTGSMTFAFEKVFGSEVEQDRLYQEAVSPLIQEVLKGFNCTIIAYGQTGTGKTFTIVGGRTPNLPVESPDPLPGIIPRAMNDLFNRLKGMKMEYKVSVSFLELYNEEIFDLQAQSDDLQKLKMFDNTSQKSSVVIHGLQVSPVNSIGDVYAILERGRKKRRTATTLLNEMSSRSHTVFTATVEMKKKSETEEESKIAKLNMVDLAGSENIGRSGAVEKRAREAGSINQSLLVLSRVISSLCENSKHIPYRQSKLTRLLRDSLGGQSKTTFITTISPSSHHVGETINTLKYALRAKSVTNKPVVNEHVCRTALAKDYEEEILKLEKTLMNLRSENGYYVHVEYWRDLNHQKSLFETEVLKRLAEREAIMKETASVDIAIAQAEQEITLAKNKLEEKEKTKKKLIQNIQEERDALTSSERVLAISKKYSSDLHDQVHEDLTTQYKIQTEQEKVKEQLLQKMTERKSLAEKLEKLQSIRLESIGYLKDFKNSVFKGAAEVQEHVNSLTFECESSIKKLQEQLGEYYDYHNNGFLDISSVIDNLKNEYTSFCESLRILSEKQKSASMKWINTCEEYTCHSNLNISDFGAFEDLLNAFERNVSVIIVSSKTWKDDLYNKLKEREQFLQSCLDEQMNLLQTVTKKTSDLMRNLKEAYEGYRLIVAEAPNRDLVNKNWEEHINAVENVVCSLETFCKKSLKEEFEKHLTAHLKMKGFTNIGMQISSNMLEFCDASVTAFDDFRKNFESRNLSETFQEDVNKLTGAALVNCDKLNQERSRLSLMSKSFKEMELLDEEPVRTDICITDYCNKVLKHKESVEGAVKKLDIDMKNFTSDQITRLEKLKQCSSCSSETLMTFLTKNICSIETDQQKNLKVLDFSKDQHAGSLDDSKHEDKQQTPTSAKMTSNNLECQKSCPFCNTSFGGHQLGDSALSEVSFASRNKETSIQQSTKIGPFDLDRNAQQGISEVQKKSGRTGKESRKRQRVCGIEDEIVNLLMKKEDLSDEEKCGTN